MNLGVNKNKRVVSLSLECSPKDKYSLNANQYETPPVPMKPPTPICFPNVIPYNELGSKIRAVRLKESNDVWGNINKCQNFLEKYKNKSKYTPISSSIATDTMSIGEPESTVPVPFPNTKELRPHHVGPLNLLQDNSLIRNNRVLKSKVSTKVQYNYNKVYPKKCPIVKNKEGVVLLKKDKNGCVVEKEECKLNHDLSTVEFEMLEAQCNLEAELENALRKDIQSNETSNCKEETVKGNKVNYKELLNSLKDQLKFKKHTIAKEVITLDWREATNIKKATQNSNTMNLLVLNNKEVCKKSKRARPTSLIKIDPKEFIDDEVKDE